MTDGAGAALLIEALRLDRESADTVRRQAFDALELGVGGFLLFGGEAGRVGELLEELAEAAERPLWFAADLERGAGQQFAGLTSLPPPAGLAHDPDPVAAARLAGQLTGSEAARLGINWVLAPVLDLDCSDENPIVATRSFGADSATVARLGRTWIESCQAAGPAACAKHFPGHGRTVTDSHLAPTVVEAAAEELLEDLRPFAETAHVVETVMVAHVVFPSLSPSGSAAGAAAALPATRDPALIGGLLREQLGFSGLVATDALTMRGFASPEREGPAAVEAVRAGCDLLLYPGDAETVAAALDRAAGRDPAVAQRISDASARSSELLRRMLPKPSDAPPSPGPESAAELAVRSIVEYVPTPEPPNVGGGLDARALRRERPLAVQVLSDDAGHSRSGEVGHSFVDGLVQLGWDVRLDPSAERPDTAPSPTGPTILVIASSPRAFKGWSGLSPATETAVRREVASRPTYLVVLGHLRLLQRLGAPGLCAWWPEPLMERAAARWLDRAANALPADASRA